MTSFESQHSQRKLTKAYARIDRTYPGAKFSKIFSSNSLSCESNVLKELEKLRPSDIKFALIKANSSSLIDEVETDILLDYAEAIEASPFFPEKFAISKGSDSLAARYQAIFNGGCIEDNFKKFSEGVSAQNFEEEKNALLALNDHAYKNRLITKSEFRLVNMLANLKAARALSISSYRQKKARLSQDFSLNTSRTTYHDDKRKKGSKGLRYSIYANYSALQIKEMVALLEKMDRRFNQDSSEILFVDAQGAVQEKIELNHTEQLRLALKLYAREKQKLLAKSYFKGANFSYPTLLAVAFETGNMTENELRIFSKLEKKTKSKSFWQKATGFLGRLDFLASSLGGPIIGIGYSLTVSLVDGLINKKQAPPPKYEHDLFYGNCEMTL